MHARIEWAVFSHAQKGVQHVAWCAKLEAFAQRLQPAYLDGINQTADRRPDQVFNPDAEQCMRVPSGLQDFECSAIQHQHRAMRQDRSWNVDGLSIAPLHQLAQRVVR